MKFKFIEKMDSDLFHETRGAWTSQMESNEENTSQTYYTAGLEFCEKTLNGGTSTTDGGICVCAVIEDGQSYAAALLIVSHAKSKSETRMLDVYVQPSLNLANAEPNYAELAWIAATLIVGCLGMTYATFPSKQLKIHTAFPLDKRFMTAVTTAMFTQAEFADLYEVGSQGNWLVVTKKNGVSGTKPPTS